MPELLWTRNGLIKSLPVLDMAVKGADSRTENVGKGVFSQKKSTYYSHAFGVLVIGPERP
jgi:hypothetical protein